VRNKQQKKRKCVGEESEVKKEPFCFNFEVVAREEEMGIFGHIIQRETKTEALFVHTRLGRPGSWGWLRIPHPNVLFGGCAGTCEVGQGFCLLGSCLTQGLT